MGAWKMAQTNGAPTPGMNTGADGWDPIFGQRVFRSARNAWMVYGQYRFSVSERTFYNYVGEGKACFPRDDSKYFVEDIEMLAQSQGWPLASFFVRGAQTGGQGESRTEDFELGVEIQKEKHRKMKMEADLVEIDLKKKMKELLSRSDYEKRLAAAAAVVSNGLETLVYDNVREMIHLCGGSPEKEDSLREYLLEKIRKSLHAFSYQTLYAVSLIEDGSVGGDWEEEAGAYAVLDKAVAATVLESERGSGNGTGNVD